MLHDETKQVGPFRDKFLLSLREKLDEIFSLEEDVKNEQTNLKKRTYLFSRIVVLYDEIIKQVKDNKQYEVFYTYVLLSRSYLYFHLGHDEKLNIRGYKEHLDTFDEIIQGSSFKEWVRSNRVPYFMLFFDTLLENWADKYSHGFEEARLFFRYKKVPDNKYKIYLKASDNLIYSCKGLFDDDKPPVFLKKIYEFRKIAFKKMGEDDNAKQAIEASIKIQEREKQDLNRKKLLLSVMVREKTLSAVKSRDKKTALKVIKN